MRILSIDYGKKRTGLAVTDPLQIIANGLATVATPELFEFCEAYIQKEQVERIVIGKPTQPMGSLARTWRVWRISSTAGARLIPRCLSSTTMSALRRFWHIVHDRRRREEEDEKRKQGIVDEISATIILQDFMQSRR